MMKKWITVIFFALVFSVFGFAEEFSAAEQEAAFDQLTLKIRQNSLNSKDIKKIGMDDDAEKMDIDFDGFEYVLDFRNRSLVEFADLKVECRFFYEEESLWRAGQTSYGNDLKGLSKIEQKYYEDSLDVSLKSGERYKTETQPFVIKSWVLDSGYYFSSGTPDRLDADPIGLWVKISFKTSSGETVARDFYESDSIPSRISWEGKSI